MELASGRPNDLSGRLPKEIRVYDFLDSLGIEYMRIDHAPCETMEECAAVDKALCAMICKNLFLCNRQKTDFYLLMIPSHKHFETKKLSKQIGSARLSFAGSEFLEEYLDITPGSVSVLGLMNDHKNHVRLLIDRDVFQSEFFGCHPCINTSSLKLKFRDITEKFLPAVHHDFTIVDL